jgi:hypothetical protein
MVAYLWWIGLVNGMGFFLLLGAMSDHFADGLLRRWTKIIPDDEPYVHSKYSRVWLWWAVIGAGFYAGINLIATGWPAEYARVIVWGNVYAYGFFEVLAIFATISRRWGKGIWTTHFLWIGQGGWGVWAALTDRMN